MSSASSSGSGPRGDLLFQAVAFDQLHREEAVLVVDLEDRADVRMIQRRGSLRLTEESLAVLRGVWREEFKRHGAAELGVLSLVDNCAYRKSRIA